MLRSPLGFGLLWLGFLGYATFLAPPDQPDTLDLIIQMINGPWEGINPLIIALFNLMGVLPVVYGMFLYSDGRGQRLPAFVFAAGTFLAGAFALLPYLALRRPNPEFNGPVGWWIRIQDSRWLGMIVALGALGLCGWGVMTGDWADFSHQWQTNRFIHVMSLDFLLLSSLTAALLGDDLARRGVEKPGILGKIALIPFFGPLIYICCRPALQSNIAPIAPQTASDLM
ncbi:DUF2834 domain-containing protein [Spirulina sp. CCNP1310]|uniref:DUF2834 domain-containing protein n=1 Tax=Spirulina sp. CCNP1310 TaxID=3110249 RepID=UPI002B2048EC|nr:DUF2834 domain-containing protein [Spirulina sp. CCNP1310]MEA5419327.1 DUF2834 domain-containing protein [Spirulina sp. CCNP1310]